MGTSTGDMLAPLFATMKGLRTDWPKRGWSWDTRLSCASSSFGVELEQQAHAAARKALATEWNPGTLQSAPAHVKDIAQKSGGLRSGQMVFAAPPVGRFFVYGLWWPWGDGMTISLRVGLGGGEFREEILGRVRESFGIEL